MNGASHGDSNQCDVIRRAEDLMKKDRNSKNAPKNEDRNSKNASKKIDALNPKASEFAKKTDADEKAFKVEGATIIKRFNAKVALIEREVLIPGTTLKVRVRLYHAAIGDKVFESPERKKANEWVKENTPARAKKTDKGRGIIVKMQSAKKALSRAMNMLDKAAKAKGVSEKTKKLLEESSREISAACARITVEANALNVALLPPK